MGGDWTMISSNTSKPVAVQSSAPSVKELWAW